MKRNIIRSIVMFVAVFAVAVAAPAHIAFADTTSGIGGRPANPDPDNPRTESIFIYELGRGATKRDAVYVINNSDEKQVIDLYAVDGLTTNTGAFTCAQRVDEKTGVGAWVKLGKKQVTLAPSQKVKVPFSVTVAENADVGEHNGCMVFQSATDEGEVRGNVRIRTRQALRMVVTIPGDLRRDVSIDSYSLAVNGDTQNYAAVIANSGNVSADTKVGVHLETLFGELIYTNGGDYPVLSDRKLELTYENVRQPFPQQGTNYTIWLALYEIFGGWHKTHASVTYDNRPGVFGVIDQGDNLTTKESPDQFVFIPPSLLGWIILGMLTVLIIGLISWKVLQRGSRKKLLKKWEVIEVQCDEDIVTIAKYYEVDWKKLAKVNNVKAPYIVREGQEIHVPKKDTRPAKKKTPKKKSAPRKKK